MMAVFDINGSEFVLLLLVVVVVIGPRRLPGYAQRFGRFVRVVVHQLSEAKRRVDDEFSADGEPLHWEDYDPRKYDPRRIVKDAFAEEQHRESERAEAQPSEPASAEPARVNTVPAAAKSQG